MIRNQHWYHKETQTGAEFVDRDQREFLGLQHMGINVEDLLPSGKEIIYDLHAKFIHQGTTNSRHRSLAQIFHA